MKPINMKTWEVQAVLADRKTVTRRVVKPKPMWQKPPIQQKHHLECWGNWDDPKIYKSPYCPGDILYVRETWCKTDCFGLQDGYVYKANDNSILENTGFSPKWRPSIHMPREAARIFLRVTDVRVQRLQETFSRHESTIFNLQKEGVGIGEQCRECIETYGSPCCIDTESECGMLDDVRSDFANLWDSTLKPKDRAHCGWQADPWVWVVAFEKVSREEALSCTPIRKKVHLSRERKQA